MNKNLKLLVLILFFGEIIFSSELEIGKKMPGMDYPLLGIDGKNITLGDIKGATGTLVIFSCNTCPWVLRWEDRYVSIANRYSQKGIGMIAINSNASRFKGDDSLDKMLKHASENNYNFPYAQDPDSRLAKAFGATKTPHIYLFNEKSKLVYRGAIDDNARDANMVEENYLANAIDQMLDNKTIEKQVSKAIGCSIKFP